ncbi:MAG TPA: hypothetical protein VGJ73_12765 [Verrucomicrobiae bacterium]
MKRNGKFLVLMAFAFACGWRGCLGGEPASVAQLQNQLEQFAQTNDYFSLPVVVNNRPIQLWPSVTYVKQGTNNFRIVRKPNPLAGQYQLMRTLKRVSGNRAGLATLLSDPHPRVRTLALGAIFQREDGRDLPLIASLINDSSPTFPYLHENLNQQGGWRPLSDTTNSQTVGDVAQRMLAFWGVTHVGGFGHFPGSEYQKVTSSDFAVYWTKYAGRSNSASWFAVKMKRATRQTIPIQPEYLPDIQKVLSEMAALPMPDRAWTELYVLAPQGWYESEPGEEVVSGDALLGMIKGLGPEALLRFLQRQPVSDDPDLLMGKDSPDFVRVSNFMLLHADKLLRPGDADAVLACQYVLRDSGAVNPSWAIGAALAKPKDASKVLRHALAGQTDREDEYESDAGDITGALWRIRGPAEIHFLVNWFYTAQPMINDSDGQQIAFFWAVEAAARPDTKQLIAALVKDPRFDRTDWNVLKEILKIVNTERSVPLVAESDIYAAAPNGLLDERIVLPEWRNLLRREYALPEKPVPAAMAVPEKVLTVPAWSVPIPRQEDRGGQWRLVPSPDGQCIALLSREVVTIWRTDTGKWVWQLPSFRERIGDYPAVPGDVAFKTSGQLLVFDHGDYGRFLTWDLAGHHETKEVLLSGKPTSGVDDGRYSFDRSAQRMAFAGYNYLGCFDTRTGAALWMHPHEGGVNIPAVLSADGTRLAVGGGADFPNAVRLYEAVTGERLRRFDSLGGHVLGLAISANGRRLAIATAANGLQLWDCANGKMLQTFAWHVPGWDMGEPEFSADGQWLAAVGFSSTIGAHVIGVFDTATGKLKWVIQFQTDSSFGANTPLAFSPDGKYLYTATGQLEAWLLK